MGFGERGQYSTGGLRGVRSLWAAAPLVWALGTTQILVLTAGGVGVMADSVDYLAGAISLANGQGFTDVTSGKPISHWPPLFSAVLAGLHRALGLPPAEAGRYWNAAVFGLIGAVTMLELWRLARNALWTAAGTFLVLTSPALISGAAALLTEALFTLLVLAACAWLHRALATGGWIYVVLLGVTAGLAALQRYIGGFLLPGCGLLLLTPLMPRPWRERLGRAVVFGLVAAAPVAAWGWRNAGATGSFFGSQGETNRQWSSVGRRLVEVTSRWVAPERAPAAVRTAALAAAVGLLVWAARRAELDSGQRLMMVSAASLAAVYLAALAASAWRLPVTLGDRVVSPVWPLVVVASVGAAHQVRRRAVLALLAVWLTFPAMRFGGAAAAMLRDGTNLMGHNFNDRTWRTSATVAWVRSLPAGVVLYSNAPDALWFHTGITAGGVPALQDSGGRCPAGRECLVVWFDRMEWRSYLPKVPQLAERFGLTELRRFSDATVWTWPGS
jgi:hypothetical protein